MKTHKKTNCLIKKKEMREKFIDKLLSFVLVLICLKSIFGKIKKLNKTPI